MSLTSLLNKVKIIIINFLGGYDMNFSFLFKVLLIATVGFSALSPIIIAAEEDSEQSEDGFFTQDDFFCAEYQEADESILEKFDIYDFDSSDQEVRLGGFNLNSVIGTDDRTPVSDVTVFPYRAIVKLFITYSNGEEMTGTGYLIEDDTILTAAHCVNNLQKIPGTTSSYGVPASVLVAPAFDYNYNTGSYILNYGSTYITTGYCLQSYVSSYSDYMTTPNDYDWGIMKLNSPLGYNTGHFSLSNAVNSDSTYTIAGYPAKVNNIYNKTMYKSSGALSMFQNHPNLLTYSIDVSEGNSGSPIFISGTSSAVGVCNQGSDSINYGNYWNTETQGLINQFTSTHITAFRAYNSNSGEHFYTKNSNEYYSLGETGWSLEGKAWFTRDSGTPVYRLYNPNAGDHHYTTSVNEKNTLINLGWRYESVAFYVPTSGAVPVYRLYNPNAATGSHFYTTSINEVNSLVSAGWINENIAWYTDK